MYIDEQGNRWDEVHRIHIAPAKDVNEAKLYIEKMLSPMNIAHAMLMRGLMDHRLGGDPAVAEKYQKAAEGFRDAMGYLTAVEAWMANEIQRGNANHEAG